MSGHADQYLYGISPHGVGLPDMIISFTVITIASRFLKDSPPEIQQMVENIRFTD